MPSPYPSLPVLLGIVLVAALGLAHSDQIHQRASEGLGRGMPEREAELARGFVLGDDGGVDQQTKEDFRRSGLSHLLAVSGQNVTLLALLAMPLLGWFGIPLRERLLWVLGLIAVYVPVAGAGPSVQRAAVMGAVGLLATLQGRRPSRIYALVLAAAVTLAVSPGIAADIGWQLSFAAVVGILAFAGPVQEAIVARLGRGPWRQALAEGLAMTVSATLATAPLIAFHFEELSTTTLVANVLALPATAPAMWLGMLSAAAAQVPGLPLEPLNGLDALLLAYIAQVASWCAEPSWAQLRVHLGGGGLFASYLGLGLLAVLVRVRLWVGSGSLRSGWVGRRMGVVAGLAALALLMARLLAAPGDDPTSTVPAGLRVEVLDVGQGDAILLQPRRAPAVLVDGGPPGDGLRQKLQAAGVRRLGAAVITHDQSDHAGGIEELLGEMPLERLLFGRLKPQTLAAVRAAGVHPQRLAAGREVRSGSLRLRVLWPPPELLADPPPNEDPNRLALVIEARWHDFSMLLTADAEAEAVPLDPGPVDVLKVAHHGSEDSGLGRLLELTRPRLAVISVGAGNPYGHPTGATLKTLANHRVPTLRTDEEGTLVIDVTKSSMRLDD